MAGLAKGVNEQMPDGELDLGSRIGAINRQAKSQLTHTFNSQLHEEKQPIIIQTTVDLDGNEVARTVNNVNATDAMLRRF